MTADERARYDAMSVPELEVHWVALFSLRERTLSRIEQAGLVGTLIRPVDAHYLVGRYREAEARWGYVDELLRAHEARDPEQGWQPVGGPT